MNHTTLIRTLCASAFASVALSMTMPVLAQAAALATTSATPPATSAIAQVASPPAGMVAKVNGVTLTTAQLDAAVRASGQPDTPALRQALKNQFITRELISQAAAKAHYDTRPEAIQAGNNARTLAANELYLRDHVHPAPVTDAQVKARYDAIVASLGATEYKPRTIVVGDRTSADGVLAKLKSGVAFDALAREVSLAPNRAAGGETPWMSLKTPLTEGQTQGFPMAVAQAITTLPAGAVSPQPIAAGNQWVIVKVDAQRPTQIPPFDQAQNTIRQQLQALALEKASAQFVGGLLKK